MSVVTHITLSEFANADLYRPQLPTETAVIFLPGVSGGALSSKYDKLKGSIINAEMAFMALEAWESVEVVESRTIASIFEDIDLAVSHLKEAGFTQILAIGKSFGGGVLLARNHPDIKALSLWAPAFGMAELGTFEELKGVQLGQIEQTMDIMLSNEFVSGIETPIQLIHGDTDSTIPLSNSQKFAETLPNASLEIIPTMGHSAKTPEEEGALIQMTISFLRSQI